LHIALAVLPFTSIDEREGEELPRIAQSYAIQISMKLHNAMQFEMGCITAQCPSEMRKGISPDGVELGSTEELRRSAGRATSRKSNQQEIH
jgi:hypothetical protein